ncbi:MAG: hypothetical protein K2O12_02050, partial [Muribaculaceae bacterium]|nr:hypothetical protein [Muribaculaceae bacterium]
MYSKTILSVRACCFLTAFFIMAFPAVARLSFSGSQAQPIIVEPHSSSGLNAIYVLSSVAGVTATAAVDGGASGAAVYKFSNLGAAYAQEIKCTSVGADVEFALEEGDMGYIVQNAAGRNSYYWVVDYSKHEFLLSGVAVDEAESDCDMLALRMDGSAPVINYYTINGRAAELSREIEVTYNTLTFDSEAYDYRQHTSTVLIDHASDEGLMRVGQPLCSTDFIVSGDRFLRQWGEEHTARTNTVNPKAVEATTKAVETERDAPNEKKEEGNDALGGSAPCEITFTAAVTDGADFRQWQ